MIKSEIFASVLRDVCEVTGISERDIMSKSKSEEIVDARHLLVVTLRRSGYYPGMIAERLHISGRAVRKMIGSFRSRAEQALASVDRQREIVDKAGALLSELNPAYREKAENDRRFDALEGSVGELKGLVRSLIDKMG